MKRAGKWGRILKKKKILLLAVAAAGICLIVLGTYFWGGKQGGRSIARDVPVQEAQAEAGTISDTIVGTGNLEYEESSSVTIPSGIVIDEVNVEENDWVSQGDVLAVVNQVSVLRAMADIQEELDELDEEMEDSKDAAGSQSLTSKLDGTVKKIYVQEGQESVDCMAEHGALLLLSIDDSADGEEDELAVTAAAGTVEDIYVSEGDNVYEGTALLKITDDGQSLEYQELMAQRQELVQKLQKLTALSKSGVVTAETDGIIKSVNISAEGSAKETESGQDMAAASASAVAVAGNARITKHTTAVVGSAGAWENTVMTAESTQPSGADEAAGSTQPSGAEGAAGSTQPSEADGAAGNVQDTQEAGKNLTLEVVESGTSNQKLLVIESPKTGNVPQTSLRAEDGSYQGQISWKPKCKKFAAETSYQAYVTLTAGEGYLFHDKSINQTKAGVLSGVAVAENGKELSFCLTYPFTASEKTNSQKEENSAEGNEDKENEGAAGGKKESSQENEKGETEGTKGENGKEGSEETAGDEKEALGGNAEENNNGTAVGTVSETGGTVKSQSVSMAVTNVSSQSSSQESSQSSAAESTESGNEVTAFTMSSSDTMILAVNVDELDINSVSEGQQAEITLDAIEEETFTGTVAKVGGSASSANGGVAKYTVEVEIPGDERMKEGMNASATITIEKREDVVTIPVNALQERGKKVFVYTQTDSEGNLAGEQEVTTGLSDGSTVEITEGLSEGDKVYYQRLGNISDQKNSQDFGGMEGAPKGNMGEMPGGGGMPDRGSMPGGGMPGNQ